MQKLEGKRRKIKCSHENKRNRRETIRVEEGDLRREGAGEEEELSYYVTYTYK